MTGLAVHDLGKIYGGTPAVRTLSFRADPGRVTGFLGPNGAGKSTTLRILLGLVRPDRGTATVNGVPYAELDQPSRTVGAVLDLAGAHPGMTGRRHLRVAAALGGHPGHRVDDVLTHTDLTEAADRTIGTYSTGMKQRLALATALLGDPEILVLDEPTNGLDPAGVRWLRELLRSRADSGRTVLVSSHQLSELEQSVDDVVIIHRGSGLWSGPIGELAEVHGSLEEAFLTLTSTCSSITATAEEAA